MGTCACKSKDADVLVQYCPAPGFSEGYKAFKNDLLKDPELANISIVGVSSADKNITFNFIVSVRGQVVFQKAINAIMFPNETEVLDIQKEIKSLLNL